MSFLFCEKFNVYCGSIMLLFTKIENASDHGGKRVIVCERMNLLINFSTQVPNLFPFIVMLISD